MELSDPLSPETVMGLVVSMPSGNLASKLTPWMFESHGPVGASFYSTVASFGLTSVRAVGSS